MIKGGEVALVAKGVGSDVQVRAAGLHRLQLGHGQRDSRAAGGDRQRSCKAAPVLRGGENK